LQLKLHQFQIRLGLRLRPPQNSRRSPRPPTWQIWSLGLDTGTGWCMQ